MTSEGDVPIWEDKLAKPLFEQNEIAVLNTQLQWSGTEWFQLEHAYSRAAERLIETTTWGDPETDFQGLVVAFLLRHSVECALKGLFVFCAPSKTPRKKHRLDELWNEIAVELDREGIDVEDRYCRLMVSRIVELNAFDPSSTRLRYPSTDVPVQFDARRLHQGVVGILDFINGLVSCLDASRVQRD